MNGAPAGGGLNGGSSSSMPIHAGQQMDLNFIFAKVLELSEQLRVNREQTQGLIAGAEELAVGFLLRYPPYHASEALCNGFADRFFFFLLLESCCGYG